MRAAQQHYKILLVCALMLIGGSILVPYRILPLIAIIGLAFIVIFDRGALKDFGNIKIWIFIFIIIIVIPVITGVRNSSIYSIPYSSENFTLGIQMIVRFLCIYCGIILITRNISISRITDFLEKRGFSDFAYMFPIGLNIIPIVRRSFSQIYTAFKIRGGFKRDRVRNVYRLFLALLINTVKISEEISQVIELKRVKKNNI